MGNICQSLFINILMIKFISQKCGHFGLLDDDFISTYSVVTLIEQGH